MKLPRSLLVVAALAAILSTARAADAGASLIIDAAKPGPVKTITVACTVNGLTAKVVSGRVLSVALPAKSVVMLELN